MLLRYGSKNLAKIKVLQKELNALYAEDELKVDGIFGSKTKAKVSKFQRQYGILAKPTALVVDGIFGPKTFAVFKIKYPQTKLTGFPSAITGKKTIPDKKSIKTSTPRTENFKKELKKAFKQKGNGGDWDKFFEKEIWPDIKIFLAGIGTVENARLIAQTYVQLKAWGFSSKEIGIVFKQLLKLKNATDFNKIIGTLGSPSGKISRIFNRISGGLSKLGLIALFIESYLYARKGNYAAIFGEVYKFAMSKAVPWAGMIDALQSFLEGVLPKSYNLSIVFKVLRVLNPIALGGVAVESIAAMATALYQGFLHGDVGAMIPRLDKLTKRLKRGPVGIIAEQGDKLGGSLYELNKMSSTEWVIFARYLKRRILF